jgi:hypothetical protein
VKRPLRSLEMTTFCQQPPASSPAAYYCCHNANFVAWPSRRRHRAACPRRLHVLLSAIPCNQSPEQAVVPSLRADFAVLRPDLLDLLHLPDLLDLLDLLDLPVSLRVEDFLRQSVTPGHVTNRARSMPIFHSRRGSPRDEQG